MPDNIEKQIEEILNRLDQFVPEEGVVRRFRRRSRAANLQRAIAARLGRISLGQVMLTGIAVILLALLFRRVNPMLANWAVIAGLILFFTSFALSLRWGRGRRVERRWRGQVIDLSQPSLADRLRAWLKGRRRSSG